MAHMGLFWCHKQSSTTTSSGGGARGGATTGHCGSRCGIGRLMRKLRKQSKMLCLVTRPTTFHCQYDPLSYSRNFDRNGFGSAFDDDSANVYLTFSSRFVAASSRVPQKLANNH